MYSLFPFFLELLFTGRWSFWVNFSIMPFYKCSDKFDFLLQPFQLIFNSVLIFLISQSCFLIF
jgi:hypothetical protein